MGIVTFHDLTLISFPERNVLFYSLISAEKPLKTQDSFPYHFMDKFTVCFVFLEI